MSDKLEALLERPKLFQRDLVLAMAEHGGLPAGSLLRQVAELENAIAAVEAGADLCCVAINPFVFKIQYAQ